MRIIHSLRRENLGTKLFFLFLSTAGQLISEESCSENQNEQAAYDPLSAIFRNCFLIDENMACTDFVSTSFNF